MFHCKNMSMDGIFFDGNFLCHIQFVWWGDDIKCFLKCKSCSLRNVFPKPVA